MFESLETEDVLGQNYTGPYVSNGKFQKSVAFGDRAPLDELDSYSRLHDTIRALYKPGNVNRAADSLYMQRTNQIGGTLPALAGPAVVYGNAGIHSLENLTSAATTGLKLGGLPGLLGGIIYGGVENMYQLYDYMTHFDESRQKVLATEKLDPFPQYQLGPHAVDSGSTKPKGTLPEGGKGLKVEGSLVSPTRPTGSGGSEMGSASAYYSPAVDDGLFSVSPSIQWMGGGEYTTMVKGNKKKTKGVAVQLPQKPKQKAKVKAMLGAMISASNQSNKARASQMPTGAITAINTAPVAIGNSVRGSKTSVMNTPNGVRLIGRDFMFAPTGTGTVSTWTLCGGTPLSPAAFADTVIANYMRMYAKFKFRRIVAHYITSSPTSANGDVMFYYNKDRSSVFLNQTSPQLLGFVLSDPNTVIGPQWVNHSVDLKVTGSWKLTDYGMHDGIEEYSDGDLFLLSKTSTTDSPGYVLFDYDIEFAEHQLQPRLLTFPIPRIQWHQCNIGANALVVAYTGNIDSAKPLTITGLNIAGTASSPPTNGKLADVYKVILDVTNSNPAGWTNVTVNNLFATVNVSDVNPLTVTDGMTLYALCLGTTSKFTLFTSPTEAYASQGANSGLCWGVGAAVTFGLQCWMSYVGSVQTTNLIPNY